MSETEYGSIVNVWIEIAGGELAAAALAGATELTLEDASDFADDGGTLLAGALLIPYTAADDDTGKLTLYEPLAAPLEAGAWLAVFPAQLEKRAQVMVGDFDEAIEAVVPVALWPLVPEGTRSPENAESVQMERVQDDFVVSNVTGTEPVIDGGFLDPATIVTRAEFDIVATTANGKSRLTWSLNEPVNPDASGVEGDLWFRRNATNVIGQWQYTGGQWVARQLDGQVIANLDAGKITTGFLAATTTISAGTPNGRRVQLDGTGTPAFEAFNADNVQTVNIDGSNNLVTGILATAVTGRRIELRNNDLELADWPTISLWSNSGELGAAKVRATPWGLSTYALELFSPANQADGLTARRAFIQLISKNGQAGNNREARITAEKTVVSHDLVANGNVMSPNMTSAFDRPRAPYGRMHKVNTQSIPNATDEPINLMHDESTGEFLTDSTLNRFYVVAAGIWDIRAAIRWGVAAAGVRQVRVKVARWDLPVYFLVNTAPGSTGYGGTPVSVSGIMRLNGGDIVTLNGYQNSGAALNVGFDELHGGTYLQMKWLAP